MLCLFQEYSKVIQLYTYVYPFFFRFFSLIGGYKYWVEFPVLCSSSLLIICYIYSSVYVRNLLISTDRHKNIDVSGQNLLRAHHVFVQCAEHFMFSCQVVSDPLWPRGLRGGSSVHGISQEEYWSGLPFPSLADLPDLGQNLHLMHLQADSLPLSLLGSPVLYTLT